LNLTKIKPVKAFFSSDKELYNAIRNIFGFYPTNIFLYKLAFRHKSVAEESYNGVKISNERLEYLGDAILGAIVADYLFKIFPYKDEGFLTEMRSKIVSRASLNKLSQKLGIDKLIQSNQDSKSAYRSMKGDAFEAFVGAMYLDKGYEYSKKIIVNHIINFHFDIDVLENLDTNFKSKLIEWAQKEKKSVEFNVIDEVGSGYNKQYVVEILVEKKSMGKGQDYSIKSAEQNASEKAWKMLEVAQ